MAELDDLRAILKEIGNLIKADKNSTERLFENVKKAMNDGKTDVGALSQAFRIFYNELDKSVINIGTKSTSTFKATADNITKAAHLITNDILVQILKIKKSIESEINTVSVDIVNAYGKTIKTIQTDDGKRTSLFDAYEKSIKRIQADTRKVKSDLESVEDTIGDSKKPKSERRSKNENLPSADTYVDRLFLAKRNYDKLPETDRKPTVEVYNKNLNDFHSDSRMNDREKTDNTDIEQAWQLASKNVIDYRKDDLEWQKSLTQIYNVSEALLLWRKGRLTLMDEELEILRHTSATAEKINNEDKAYADELKNRDDIGRDMNGIAVKFWNSLESSEATLLGNTWLGDSARTIADLQGKNRESQAEADLQKKNLKADLDKGLINQEQYDVKTAEIDRSLENTKVGNQYAAIIKIAEDLAKKIVAVVEKIKKEVVELFKQAWKDIKEVASYGLSTSYTFNSSARNQALTYGISDSQNYAYTQTQKLMGMSSLEDLYYANSNQQAKFQELMQKEEQLYNKMTEDGSLEVFQEMQIDFQLMKQELESEVIRFLADNKSTIINVMKMGLQFLKFQLSITSGILKMLSWFGGNDVDETHEQTSGITSESELNMFGRSKKSSIASDEITAYETARASTEQLASSTTTNNNQRTLYANSTYSPTINSFNESTQSLNSTLEQQRIAIANFFNS